MPPVAKKNKRVPKNNVKDEKQQSTHEPEENLAISGQLDKKIKKSQARIDKQRGVVIVRHLPHGFFEDQLKNYFQQFGKVTRLRLARSKRTGGSKGFAFIEFEYPEVAKVAAETMDNYLMFQKLVKADYIPPENQRFNYFKTSVRQVVNKIGKPIYVSGRTAVIQKQAEKYNKWTDKDYQKRVSANLRKLQIFKKKYADLGIDFDKFTVKPNRHLITKKEAQERVKEAQEKEEKENDAKETKSEPGSLLLIKKRTKSVSEGEIKTKKAKEENPAKSSKKLELKDLLEDTLKDEGSSEDEDFIPVPQGDADDTSDEESYGIFDTDAKTVNSSNENEEKSHESEEETSPQPKRKAKSFEKSSTVDRMSELLKRKPNVGGIQKHPKKSLKDKSKQTNPSLAKNSLKLAAVNEIKQQGKMKQLKGTDLKKKDSKKNKFQKK